MKKFILVSAALFLQTLCFAAEFKLISDAKVYDGDYNYICELKKGDIVRLFDCFATDQRDNRKLNFAFSLRLNIDGKKGLVDLSAVIPNETSGLFDENIRYTTLSTQGKQYISIQNIDILRSRTRDKYYETYKNKLDCYNEPDIFELNWYEHYEVTAAAKIENCFLYFTDEKNYTVFLYVKDIKAIEDGYIVSCEVFKNYVYNLFAEKKNFLENLKKTQIVSFRMIFDGDYLYIYTEENQKLFSYALMNSEYSIQMEYLIRNGTCDLSNVTWPRHADGSCDYDTNGNITAGASKRFPEAAIPKPAPALGKTAAVTENLRLRTDDTATAAVVTTLAAGTCVKVLAPGRADTIDGIASNWVQVRVLGDAKDKDGNAIAADTTGWLFGGYLSEAEESTHLEAAESERPDTETADAKEASAPPIVPIAAGIAALAVLLGVALLAAKRRKGGKDR